jgi:small GTP-binding protein
MTDFAPASTPATANTTSGPLAELREKTIRALVDAGDHIGKIPPDGAADRTRLNDAAADLRDMFLLVTIIGEFNAGKSTFVNALIGEALLPMGITPTTDVIEVIRYAPVRQDQPVSKSEAVREWANPNTGSAGVAIVDTPGTGSVFQKHEEIAKSFLHRSDLVIFLLSAKRAFADTERLYMELAKNYGKKVVVVINQSDLLEDRERGEVHQFVKQQIDQFLGIRPPIYMVSAKRALQSGTKIDPATLVGATTAPEMALSEGNHYGIRPLLAYLKTVFEQVPPAKQKLITRLSLLQAITERHTATVDSRLALIGQDQDAAESLQREIDGQAAALDKQFQAAYADVQKTLAGIIERGNRFIDERVNVLQATLGRLDRDKMAKAFEETVIADAPVQLQSAQSQYVNALIDGSRAYWRGVLERLSKLDAVLREEAVGMDASAYADQRAALQAALAIADVETKAYTDNRVIHDIQAELDQQVKTFTYSLVGGTGGAVAVLLSLLGAAAPGVVPPLAVVGLIVGIPALLGGGVFAVHTFRRAADDAKTQLAARIAKLDQSYKTAMIKLTADERGRLSQYGRQILAPVFSQLGAVAARYREQQARLAQYRSEAEHLTTAVNKAD